MKAKLKDGILKRNYEMPEDVCVELEKSAKDNLRSINNELIIILREYFEGGLIRLDATNKKIIGMYAEMKGFSNAEAVNYLLSAKISDFKENHDKFVSEADGDVDQMERKMTEYLEQEELNNKAKKGKPDIQEAVG